MHSRKPKDVFTTTNEPALITRYHHTSISTSFGTNCSTLRLISAIVNTFCRTCVLKYHAL